MERLGLFGLYSFIVTAFTPQYKFSLRRPEEWSVNSDLIQNRVSVIRLAVERM